MFQYLYFVGSIYFLLWWITLFILGKKCRQEMILMSVIGLIFAPLVQYMHLVDWWKPVFLLNTFLKIEDLIFGFSVAGISTAAYHIFVNNHERKYKKLIPSLPYEISMAILCLFALFGLFYWFNIHSYWTSVWALIVGAIFIITKRRDLIVPMIYSGLLLLAIATPYYVWALYINPDWFAQEWFLKNLSGYQILNIPIEELSWYLFIGITFSAFWEFTNGVKFLRK